MKEYKYKTILNFDNYINEHFYNSKIMNLADLAKAIANSNPGWDIHVVYEMLTKTFKFHGDDGVMTMFKEATGITIEPIIKGRYIYA